MQVSVVLPEHIELIWPQIKEYLHGAAEYTFGRYTVDDIKKGLYDKPQHLWIAFEDAEMFGAVVTEIYEYPRMKALVMHFTGGKELPKWKAPMLKLLQKFAKDHQCDIIESYGRRGWGKVFENDGFKEKFMFYELPVEN